jgi:hypothetical protein
VSADHSRALKLASLVSTTEMSELEASLDAATVVVTVDPDLPQALLTAQVLLSTLRRGPGTLALVADGLPTTFVKVTEELMTAIDPDRPMQVVRSLSTLPNRSIRVHIGATAPAALIRAVPEGFGTHIASSPTVIIRPQRPGNPIGAVYTAALAAAEVFKHTAAVRPERRVLHDHLQFCPYSLSADLGAAPDLPRKLILDLALIGVGAIGTGIVLLLKALGAQGRLVAVDPQTFDSENVGTYSIGNAADAASGILKVDLAARALGRFDVIAKPWVVADLIGALDRNEVPWPKTVLTALDSPEARRDAQRLWPDRLIDAQTGDTMLGMCDHHHGIDPCLMCIFPVDRSRPSGADLVAERLGLPRDLHPDAPLIEDHLKGLPDEQRDRLLPHLGKPICGLARATGLSILAADAFMPAVPFVSLQAACLSVARLMAAAQGGDPTVNFVQYDALFGPQAATLQRTKKRSGCTCEERAEVISLVRDRRRRS